MENMLLWVPKQLQVMCNYIIIIYTTGQKFGVSMF